MALCYGSLAALFFLLYFPRVAVLVSLYEDKIDYASFRDDSTYLCINLFLEKHNRLQLVADLTEQQLAWLEDDKKFVLSRLR
jgi:hypothetical protein